jgi:formylglycine-generating enzyme required for sulfatase activity
MDMINRCGLIVYLVAVMAAAAKADDAEAQYHADTNILTGHWVEADASESIGWFERASNWLARAKRGLTVTHPRYPTLPFAKRRVSSDIARFGIQISDCTSCPTMIVVPPGEFMMGSDNPNFPGNERPIHRVHIRSHIAISETLITFDQWDYCVRAGKCRALSDMSWGRGEHPAINVTWDDAITYVNWLNETTPGGYRLLSEAEWEYAARAGTNSTYWWGDSMLPGYANCLGCNPADPNRTTPVKTFRPNPFGLYDVAGNVWQWVYDCVGNYLTGQNYVSAPDDGLSWIVGSNIDCSVRVLRGGAWDYVPLFARHSQRIWSYTVKPDWSDANIGFRVALELTVQ